MSCPGPVLDTDNIVDLEDLVDGMNLSLEWGLENLQLDGFMDVEWAHWKILQKSGYQGLGLGFPNTNPTQTRREIWEHSTCSKNKKRRQGIKVRDNYPTRFWRDGQRDPRLRDRPFC